MIWVTCSCAELLHFKISAMNVMDPFGLKSDADGLVHTRDQEICSQSRQFQHIVWPALHDYAITRIATGYNLPTINIKFK